MDTAAPINELKLNLIGRILLTAIGAALVGKLTNMKLRGSPEQVQAVADAIIASRRFQDELSRSGATVDSVVQKLGIKHMTAREFERVLGVPFPL